MEENVPAPALLSIICFHSLFIHFFHFRLSSDTDIKNIVEQWKRKDALTETKGKIKIPMNLQ